MTSIMKRAEAAVRPAFDMDRNEYGQWGHRWRHHGREFFMTVCAGDHAQMRSIAEKRRVELIGDVSELPIWC